MRQRCRGNRARRSALFSEIYRDPTDESTLTNSESRHIEEDSQISLAPGP
jgi:hypothetical protein